MKLLLIYALLFIFSEAEAQADIFGTIKDSLDRKLDNVNVLLLSATDSGLVKGSLTDANGYFLFKGIPTGNYFIKSSYTGFVPYNSEMFFISAGNNKNFSVIHLYQHTEQLEEVRISAKKPLFEQKIDRLIINVENSITSAGSTALEILERSPGVIIDHQNNAISMNGKDGVVLMINGKMSHLPVSAVVEMLSGMSSANIEKIELITTPPASFDAAGNAGYINIVLKENNNIGTNGSYNLTLGYGKGLVSGAGINFNHRKNKLNIYGDISYSRIKGPFGFEGYSKIQNKGNVFEKYNTMDRTDTTVQINARLGLDYQFSKRAVAGILLTGYERHFTQSEKSQSSLFKNEVPDTLTTYSNQELNDWTNYGINLNNSHSFKENTNLTLNLDYIHYKNDQPVNYFASNYDGAGDFIYDVTTRSGKITYMEFWVGALDYKSKIGKRISMESGLKRTVSGFKNNVSFEGLNQSSWIRDESLSANYKLNESYSAAYVSFDVAFNEKTEGKLGFRYEYTNSKLGTDSIKNIVDRHYGNLFPTLFLSRSLNENNKINFSFNTRINRPAFTDLAPFTYYLDAKTVCLMHNYHLQFT